MTRNLYKMLAIVLGCPLIIPEAAVSERRGDEPPDVPQVLEPILNISCDHGTRHAVAT